MIPSRVPRTATAWRENWTQISAADLIGALALPEERFAAGAVGFTNATNYSSYKLTFPTVKAAANSMQVAEVAFFAANNGTGANLLTPGRPIIPIRDVDPTPSSNSPAGEAAGFAIDRSISTKYLNFGEERSGFIVTPSAGAFTVNGIQFTTANDAEARDPASYQLYGTNQAITTPNNGIGNEQNWTLISSGALALPAGRMADSAVIPVSGTTAYNSYRVIFPTVKDAATANSMQIAEVKLFAADDGVLEVNRQTGNVTLRAINPITLTEYELRSLNSHALNEANWTSITSTNADPNDTWTKTSPPGATGCAIGRGWPDRLEQRVHHCRRHHLQLRQYLGQGADRVCGPDGQVREARWWSGRCRRRIHGHRDSAWRLLWQWHRRHRGLAHVSGRLRRHLRARPPTTPTSAAIWMATSTATSRTSTCLSCSRAAGCALWRQCS